MGERLTDPEFPPEHPAWTRCTNGYGCRLSGFARPCPECIAEVEAAALSRREEP